MQIIQTGWITKWGSTNVTGQNLEKTEWDRAIINDLIRLIPNHTSLMGEAHPTATAVYYTEDRQERPWNLK